MEELTIGQRIAAKRKELGLSQIELGEKMGVSRQSVSKWEADAAIPEIDKLIALSKLFHVSVGWLLGVEDSTQPEAPPEQTFTEREWEIIDRLTQAQPKLPKWLLPLAAGAAAVSLTAALLSGAALYADHRRTEELAAISQSVAGLAASIGGGLQDASVLEDYQFLAQPSGDLNECTFRFTGIPAFHDAGSTAELLIVQNSEVILRQECLWDGSCYTAEFTLPANSGYTASFCLTDSAGIVRTSRLYDQLLHDLMNGQNPGNVSVTFGSCGFDGETITFRDLRFVIEAPDIFRDTEDLWARCDLVALCDGRELGRTDILNRSPYSKSVNFSGRDVNFYTKEQSIALSDTAGTGTVEVLLDCELTTGLQIQKVIKTLPGSAAG